jgi:hypothetical protein
MCCPSFCYVYTRRSPVALFFRDESGFCFESQSATAVFSFRALDLFWGFTTRCRFFSSCFCTCGFFHDEMGFCFGVSRRKFLSYPQDVDEPVDK